MSTPFSAGQDRWNAVLGNLRDTVRQELVARQLATELPSPPAAVLDVGCGQGTQALRLARRGYQVTGLDASAELLASFAEDLAAEPAEVRARVRLVQGFAEDLTERAGSGPFTAFLCHGVLMYLPDPDPLLTQIASLVPAGGLLSLLVRNGDALAMRPGLHGDWTAGLNAFNAASYRNRIGVEARADRRSELTARLDRIGFNVTTWYGVRVFTDTAADDAPLPADLDVLLACEEQAARTDPYRQVAALIHLIARRR